MFKCGTKHIPRPERGADAVCPHGRVEGTQPCPKCAAAWRKREAEEQPRGKPRA